MSIATERHYRAGEIAKLWRLSLRVIYAIFRDEPGVFRISGKRKTTMSVPESVLERVHEARSRGFLEEFKRGDTGARKTLVRRKKRTGEGTGS